MLQEDDEPRGGQEDLPGRQVDLGQVEQQHLACSHHRDRPDVLGHGDDVRVGVEVGIPDGEVDNQRDADEEDRRLRARERRIDDAAHWPAYHVA
jgi:hypothetical protein